MQMLCMIVWALAASVAPAATPSGAEIAESDVKAVSGMTREELVKENLALKRENQALRRELVRQRGGEPAIDLSRVREKKGNMKNIEMQFFHRQVLLKVFSKKCLHSPVVAEGIL